VNFPSLERLWPSWALFSWVLFSDFALVFGFVAGVLSGPCEITEICNRGDFSMSWKERAEFLMSLVRADLKAQGVALSQDVEILIAYDIALTDEDLAIAKARYDEADKITVRNLRRYLEYHRLDDEIALENLKRETERTRGKG
jgi:hypothetical protein